MLQNKETNNKQKENERIGMLWNILKVILIYLLTLLCQLGGK
jgi:hypothetical protein